MWYAIIPVLIICLLVFFKLGNPSESKTFIQKNTCTTRLKTTKTLSKDDIKCKLIELSKKPKPKELAMGAMCYEMAAPPDRAEYICPACGNKTLYSNNYKNVAIVNHIADYRTIIKNIKNLDIKLDESQFCRKCSPIASSPELCLVINYDNKTKIHKVCDVTEDDLKILSEFLSKKNVHKGFNDSEEPLKEHLNRLQELLGVPLSNGN
ncbi:MAG: hypothetical protein A2039_08230 [Candidatus Melainabacteria bacterium GWA2_34_9]|nr:MAG: hypothetical protein A2039_08230 [Candidatus Melainabacteria bacterium GWA2_34_9]